MAVENGIALWQAALFTEALAIQQAGLKLDDPSMYKFIRRGAPAKMIWKQPPSLAPIPCNTLPTPAGYNLRTRVAHMC